VHYHILRGVTIPSASRTASSPAIEYGANVRKDPKPGEGNPRANEETRGFLINKLRRGWPETSPPYEGREEMSRRHSAEKREVLPDPKSENISLRNHELGAVRREEAVAEGIVYGALGMIENKDQAEPAAEFASRRSRT